MASGLSGRVHSIALEGLLRLRQYCSIHKIVPSALLSSNNLSDSKLNKLNILVESLLEKSEKVVIFSQFTSSLDELERNFIAYGYRYLRLDGATSKANRARYVDEFQDKASNVQIFLISLKAGGVGLNLTNANNAILLEPWWNPAVEEQAFARIDRIGQEATTTIYRLIYKDSIEEKIDELLDRKRDIFHSMSSYLLKARSIEMAVARDIFKI